MNLCSDGHDEVCFDGHICPCCEIINEKDKEIANLNNEIDGLRDEVKGLEQGN